MEGVLRVVGQVVRQRVDLRELDHPMHGVFQVAEVDLRHGHRKRLGLHAQTAADAVCDEIHREALHLRQGLHGRAEQSRLLPVQIRRELIQPPQDQNRQRLLRGQQADELLQQRFDPLAAQNLRRDIVERVHEGEQRLPLRVRQTVEQRVEEVLHLMRVAVLHEARDDDLQGVGDAQGVLGGDLVIGVQAHVHVPLPELHCLLQKRGGRGHHGGDGRGRGQFLAVLRAAVREDLPHDHRAAAAHVALMMRQELVQQRERPALVLAGHVGVVFLEHAQIGADAVQILLAARLLEHLPEGHVLRDHVHQADVVLEHPVGQRAEQLVLAEQRGVLRLRGQHLCAVRGGADPVADQHLLEVRQLGIDRLIAARLLRRHVGELGEDHVVGFRQRVDLHCFGAVLPRAADAEIRVDEQQRFQRQVFKFQIPGGVIRRDMGDLRQALPLQPLIGIVIMQIRDALGVVAAAAEFADVVAEGSRADHRNIHRQSGLRRLPRDMERQMVHADRVRGGVEGHDLPPDPHEGDEMRLADRVQPAAVLLADQAAAQFLLRHGGNVSQRVVGEAIRFFLDEPRQHRDKEIQRLPLAFRRCAALRVGIEPVRKLVIAFAQPSLLRRGAELIHHRQAPRKRFGADCSRLRKLLRQAGEELRFLQYSFQRALRKTVFLQRAGKQPFL